LLIHVLDVSSPESIEQERTTEHVLEQLELQEKPRLTVLNKADLLEGGSPASGPASNTIPADSLFLSSSTGAGIDQLLERLERCFLPTQREANGANGAPERTPGPEELALEEPGPVSA